MAAPPSRTTYRLIKGRGSKLTCPGGLTSRKVAWASYGLPSALRRRRATRYRPPAVAIIITPAIIIKIGQIGVSTDSSGRGGAGASGASGSAAAETSSTRLITGDFGSGVSVTPGTIVGVAVGSRVATGVGVGVGSGVGRAVGCGGGVGVSAAGRTTDPNAAASVAAAKQWSRYRPPTVRVIVPWSLASSVNSTFDHSPAASLRAKTLNPPRRWAANTWFTPPIRLRSA